MMKIDNSLALSALNTPKLSTNLGKDDQALRKQTDAFESFFLKQVLDISLKSENKLFGKDAGDKIYHSMYNDTMSQTLTGGFGFSELLFNYLKDNQ